MSSHLVKDDLQHKIILHFDARNTLFVADINSRIPVEHALNTYMAGVVWGRKEGDNEWICVSEYPTMAKPCDDAISMYKLIEQEVVKIPSDRGLLRKRLGDFTQTDHGKLFREIFLKHLNMLRWKHPPSPNLTVTGLDGQIYHYLLPSFFNMLLDLSHSNVDYCVIVRTFGADAPNILKAIQLFSDGKHPDYPFKVNLKINNNIERFKRYSDERLEYTYTDSDGNTATLTKEREIYQHWNTKTGVMAVVDDFVYWQKNSYHYKASKPLWFEQKTFSVQHIMFDDNIRPDDDDSILNLRVLVGDAVHNIQPKKAIDYDHIFFVQADLLESTANLNYFVNKIKECSENFKALQKRSGIN